MRPTEPAVPSAAPRAVLSAASLLAALAVAPTPSLAQQGPEDVPPEFASVDWPPEGERLRTHARRHDFDIGFAARQYWPSLPEAEIYGEIAREEFGTLTPEGSLKWEFLRPSEDTFDFGDGNDVDALVDFAEDNGMRVHGHPLAWYRLNPPWLYEVPAERMEAVLRTHVDTVVSRYAGRVDVWDVVNEGLDDAGTGFRDGGASGDPLEADPFYAALGPEWLDIAFATARAADPDVALIYNDYGIGWLTEKSALALGLVDDLLERGVPIDGIGMQMHIEHTFERFEGFSEAMQRFADRDLDVYVTELDVQIESSEQLGVQAEVFEEIVRRCLMQPRCRALQTWGISDFYSFIPQFRPLIFDADFRAKPAYFGVRRALATRPVHPEFCTLDGARVESGAVYADDVADGDGVGGPGDAFSLRCEDVRLEGGFTSLSVRYRNPGTDTPTLDVRAGETLLASVPLAPTALSEDGDSRTLTVPVPPLDATFALELSLGSVSDGACVGIDALLFAEPTRALPPPESFEADGEGAAGRDDSNPDVDAGAGADASAGADSSATDCDPDERPDGPLDEREGVATNPDEETDDGGFLGAGGPWSVAGLALALAAGFGRRRQRRVLAARPASSRTGVGTR